MKKRILLMSVFCLAGAIGAFASNAKSGQTGSLINSSAEAASLVVTCTDPNPGNESIDKIHDGNPNTKWFTPNSMVWVQFEYSEAKTWKKYVLVSGNDAPDRDPKDWTLMGSNDGTNWTTLDTRSGEVWADRNTAYSYEFANETAYKFYYLDVTVNNGSDAIQFSELTFTSGNDTEAPAAPTGLKATSLKFASLVLRWNPATDNESISGYEVYMEGFLIGNTVGSDTLYKIEYLDPETKYSFTVKSIDFSGNVSAESAVFEVTTAVDPQLTVTANGDNQPNEGIEKLYDDDTLSKWLVFESTGWVIYHYAVAQKWDSYAVTSGNDAPGRDPSNWTIEGSTDGTTWTVIDTQAGQSWGERNATQNYTIANAAAYNYYKWNITATSGNATLIQVSELTYSLKTAVKPVKSDDAAIRVYPNPTNGIVTIEAKQAGSTVTVYNVNGQVLVTKNILNKVERMDLTSFKGMLLVKVASEGVVTTKRIVVK